jgi:hypothetical protein
MPGYLEDSQGRMVPQDMVSEIDRLRDELVREIVAKATDLSQRLHDFKQDTMADIESFISLSAERYGVQVGGKKGNVTLTTYNGEYKILRAISEYITFDEGLQAAKELIDQCIKDWSDGSRDEIKVLINDAFYVDKMGKVNTNRILGLRRLAITDPKWKRAMDAIGESLTVSGSKAYIRIYKRIGDGSYRQINMAAL